MAGKSQKPYQALQCRRPSRRRATIIVLPVPTTEYRASQREQAIATATSTIERQFGRGMIERAENSLVGKRKRKYIPKAEREPNAKRAEVAAARPRDAQGHFLKRERPTPTKNVDHYGHSPGGRVQGQVGAGSARDDDRPAPGDAA